MRFPEPDTVRWYVSDYIRHHFTGETPVLEIGAKHKPGQWWVDIRAQLGVSKDEWIGLDMEPGHGVDIVDDIVEQFPMKNDCERFATVICSEVLEHVTDPLRALGYIFRVLCPGGRVIITVPFAFPIHYYPEDYWRFTPDGLGLLLERAGFVNIETDEMNHYDMTLRDHDAHEARRRPPMHVGAVGTKPE